MFPPFASGESLPPLFVLQHLGIIAFFTLNKIEPWKEEPERLSSGFTLMEIRYFTVKCPYIPSSFNLNDFCSFSKMIVNCLLCPCWRLGECNWKTVQIEENTLNSIKLFLMNTQGFVAECKGRRGAEVMICSEPVKAQTNALLWVISNASPVSWMPHRGA